MHHSIKHLAVAIFLVLGLLASTAQAQTTLVSDDFSSNTLGNAGTTPDATSEGAVLRVLDLASQPAGESSLQISDGTRFVPKDNYPCLLYTSPSPRDQRGSRMPSSA